MTLLFVLRESTIPRMVILRKRVAGLEQTALERFVTRAARAAKLHGAVNILVTSSHELRALNRRFRRQDKPTDVLSFPAGEGLDAKFAGDLAISADIAAKNARDLGHSSADEIKILTLHGILHLAGYDHETDGGEMARREVRLRTALGLPASLIERVRSTVAKSGTKRGTRSRTASRGQR